MNDTKHRNAGKAPARFWNIAADDGSESATITLYGDVVSARPLKWTGEPDDGQYITPEGFAEDLATIRDKKAVTIKINSVGGDLYTALAIHNALKELPAQKTVVVDGIAASAASIIAMAGDKVKMFAGSLMMIHNVAGFLCDWFTIADLKKVARGFEACERSAAAIYNAKTGIDETSLRTMMDRETWMTGAEAVAKGFADELIQGEDPEIQFSAANLVLVVNGVRHNAQGLHVPDIPGIKPMASAGTATASAETEEPEEVPTKGGEKMNTIEELRAAYPELVAQIEADAVAADRARIQEIEEIQDTIGDAELIASAKFVKPTNAAALALEAMKRAKASGLEFMKNRVAEQAPAAKVPASASQPGDPATFKDAAKEDEAQAIKNAADLFAKTFNK